MLRVFALSWVVQRDHRVKSKGILRTVASLRVLGDRTGYGLYARGTETIVRDVEAKQGAVGEKHGGDGLTPRAS